MAAKTKPKHAYHHGELRASLIAAAREALDRGGPETVTLKELALELGVSQSAPYRHFPSRDAVLQAVAADGFERFNTTLRAVATDGTFEDVFERVSLAYIRFGQANRGVYRLMFSSSLLCEAEAASPLTAASEAAFQYLLSRIEPHARPRNGHTIAVWIWSTLHGIVMLDSEGLLDGPGGRRAPVDELVRELAIAVGARLHAEKPGARPRRVQART